MRVQEIMDAAEEKGWEIKSDSKVGKSEEEVGVVVFRKGDTKVTMAVVASKREGQLRFVRGKKEDDTLSSEKSLEGTAVRLLGQATVTKMKTAEEKAREERKSKKAEPKAKAKKTAKAAE